MPTPPIPQAEIDAAHAALKKHGNATEAAKALGIPRTTFQRRIARRPTQRPSDGLPAEKRTGKSLADFRAAHDKDYIVPRKIKAALTALGSGWDYEVDFLRLAAVSTTDLAMYRDQFADYWVVVDRSGKRVWTGSKSVAEEMRGMIR